MIKVSKTRLRELARRLRNSGAETVAICFLNSYVNGSNERVAETFLKRVLHRPVTETGSFKRESQGCE